MAHTYMLFDFGADEVGGGEGQVAALDDTGTLSVWPDASGDRAWSRREERLEDGAGCAASRHRADP